jgi:hypothetical protein
MRALDQQADGLLRDDSARIIASGIVPERKDEPRYCDDDCPRGCRVLKSWRGYGRHFGIVTPPRASDVRAFEVWQYGDAEAVDRALYGHPRPVTTTAGTEPPRSWEDAAPAIARAADAAAEDRPHGIRYAATGLVWQSEPTPGMDPLMRMMLLFALDQYVRSFGFTRQQAVAFLMMPYGSQGEIARRLQTTQATVSRWQSSVRETLGTVDDAYVAHEGRRSVA